jgi:EmrB/QacA subfamily drug resistance transporter
LALLAVAEFMLTLDLSIVNVALPSMRRDLGFSQSALQWVVNGYALTFAGFLLLGGRASDIFDGRRVFLGSLGMFSIASLACGIAWSGPVLVGARVVQGLAAGLLAPTTLSILTRTYESSDARNRALAIWSGVAIGGGAAGGVIGGLLTSTLSWRWVFVLNVPVGACLITFAARRLPRMPGTRNPDLDVAGAITITGSLVALMWALVRSSDVGWGATEIRAALVIAAALLGAFVLIELRIAKAPLVPFSIFRTRSIWAGNLLSFLSFLPVMGVWFFLTLYLQVSRHYTPMQTGVLFLPLSAAVVAGSQVSFRLIRGVDGRMLLAGGGLTAAAGLTWLSQMSASTGVLLVIAPATLAMAGGGLMFAPITSAATSASAQQAGLASGLLNTTRQIGGAFGLGLLTAIAAGGAGHGPQLSTGYASAFKVGALVFAATTVLGAIVLPASQRRRRPGARTRRVELATLVIASFTGATGLAAGGSAGALLAKQVTGSEASAGLPLGVLVLGSAMAALLISYVTTRVGRRKSLMLGYLIGGIGASTVLLAAEHSSLPVLLLGSVLLGSANAAIFLTRYAAAVLAAPKRQGRALGLVFFGTALGAVVSSALLGPSEALARLAGLPGAAGLYLIAAVSFVVAAGVLWLPRAGGRRSLLDERPGQRVRAGELRAALRTRSPGLALVALATTNFVMVAIMAIAPVHLSMQGMSLRAVGLVIAIHVAGMFAPAPVSGWLCDRVGPRRVLAASATLLIVVAVGAVLVDSVDMTTAMVVLALLGVGWNLGVVGGSTLLASAVPTRLRPQTEGIGEVAMGVAAAAAAPAAGLIAHASGSSTLWIACAVIAAVNLVMLRRITSRPGADRSARPSQPHGRGAPAMSGPRG